MKITPLFDRVLILPEESEKETKGGIILPSATKEKSQFAQVVAVGKGGEIDGQWQEMQVRPGDRVLYSKYAGSEITIDEKKYIILRQTDILAVLN